MDNSNPELQRLSDSQVLGSSCSLLLPSEPPDVGNWFSSYKYESPVLDSNENFEDSVSKKIGFAKNESVSKESEVEEKEDPVEFKKIGRRDEVLVLEKCSSNGLLKCGSFLGSDELERQSSNELADSLHSPSILSEPPDIRNWFLSYVYESPSFDTNNDLEDSLSKERECEHDLCDNEEENNTETEATPLEFILENKHSDDVAKCNNSSGNKIQRQQQSSRVGDDGGRGSKNASARNNPFFGRPFEHHLKVEIFQNDGGSTTKNVSTSILKGSITNLEQPQKTICVPGNVIGSSVSDDRKSLEQFISKRDSIGESSQVKFRTEVDHVSPQSNPKSNLVHGVGMTKLTHGSSGKEGEGKGISENGFVTTRKSCFTRVKDENFLRVPEGINGTTVSLRDRKDGAIERKVLAEKTNFRHSDEMEITGRWRCPQKRKPNLGPPLKQLRLGHWVHRM